MRLPIGQDNFRKCIENHFDWVDKSLLIKEILDDTADVILITRPRRFGKTLNLSMLHHFLAAETYGQSTEGLFKRLKILETGEAYTQHHRKYPVIFVTFKDVKDHGATETVVKLQMLFSELYSAHRYLMDSEKLFAEDKQFYQDILERNIKDAGALSSALKNLTRYLYQHHQTKPWLLIDEYDTPLHSAYVDGYYEEMMSLMRGMLSSALKTNPYLNRAVITGILRISKESLFSGLNNLKVYSMLQSKYGAYFGFTEEEVEQLLKRSHLQTQAQTIKHWYNGYLSGETVLYNPWSIVNCIQEQGEIKPYWINTSDDKLLKNLLTNSDEEFKTQFEALMQGDTTNQMIDENVVFADLKRSIYTWSLLLMTGYLKVIAQERTDDLWCQLTIPNWEVRSRYQKIIKEWLSHNDGIVWFNRFLENLLTGKMEQFSEGLTHIMERTVSVHDTAHDPEAFYHGLMIGLTASLYENPNYLIKSNHESGYGRYDYLILSKDPQRPTLLIELKRVRIPTDEKPSIEELLQKLTTTAQAGLQQIEQQNYAAEIQQHGVTNILKISLAFCGKRFKLLYK